MRLLRSTWTEFIHVFAKRCQFQATSSSTSGGFVRAEVVELTTKHQRAQKLKANMTLFVNDIELRIPQGTLTTYLVELIGALS